MRALMTAVAIVPLTAPNPMSRRGFMRAGWASAHPETRSRGGARVSGPLQQGLEVRLGGREAGRVGLLGGVRYEVEERAQAPPVEIGRLAARRRVELGRDVGGRRALGEAEVGQQVAHVRAGRSPDRKSTRLNSSHLVISYAVFCLKKK